jgi:hypothetical protein
MTHMVKSVTEMEGGGCNNFYVGTDFFVFSPNGPRGRPARPKISLLLFTSNLTILSYGYIPRSSHCICYYFSSLTHRRNKISTSPNNISAIFVIRVIDEWSVVHVLIRLVEHPTEVRSSEGGGTSVDLSKVEGLSLNVSSAESTDGYICLLIT